MYVTVYIKVAKKYIVVPENWCYDIDEQKLKNNGVNSNQDIRIFWSSIGVDENGRPFCDYPPKFHLDEAKEYPPEKGLTEACYIGRTKYYYKSYEAAMEYCSKFRPQPPVEYNFRRKSELPIPSLVGPTTKSNTEQCTNANENIAVVNRPRIVRNDDEDVVDDNSVRNDNGSLAKEQSQPNGTDEDEDDDIGDGFSQNDASNVTDEQPDQLNETDHSEGDVIGDGFAQNDTSNVPDEQSETNQTDHSEEHVIGNISAQNNGDNLLNESQQHETESEKSNDSSTQKDTEQNDIGNPAAENSEADVKHSLQSVQMDAGDEMAISCLFGDNTNVSTQSDGHAASGVSPLSLVLGDGETAEERDGKIIITKLFENDLEMTYTYGETPKALRPLYQIKINDIISANIPFKENSSTDRAYLVKIDGQYKEVKMAAMLVKGLSRLNGIEYRKNTDLDGAFIKALIIGLCTAKVIEEGERIHKDMLIFIKELFVIRISDEDDANGSRYLSFPKLVSNASQEIREKKYKSSR